MGTTKRISVTLLPNMATSGRKQSGAVVIDTLRFTTTAIQALQSGAASVRVVQEIEQARQLARSLKVDSRTIIKLCGERLCKLIEGFDMGNSPLEYVRDAVAGATLVFSTTNGTRAVAATDKFATCLLAGLVNRSAIAEVIHQSDLADWQIICSGTNETIAGEDTLTAGAIIDALQQRDAIAIENDSAHIALTLWQRYSTEPPQHLIELLANFTGGKNLVQAGFAADVEFACRVDLLTTVPYRIAPGEFQRLGIDR